MNNIFEYRRKEYSDFYNKLKTCLEIVQNETDFELEEFNVTFSPEKNIIDKTLKNKITIIFRKGTKTIDLSLNIPILDDDHFIINGYKKIPYFQILDIPFRITEDFITIKFNMASITFLYRDKSDTPFHFYINFLGKYCPASLIFYYFLRDRSFSFKPNENAHNLYNSFLEELQLIAEESSEMDDSDLIREIGSYISETDVYNKGDDFLYALNLAPKIDIINSQFLHTDNIVDEFMHILENNIFIDDLDYRNKRVQSESFLPIIISKLFEFALHNRRHKPRFKINKQILLSHCNQSNVIQYDFSINPIDFLTKKVRSTLIGPNSFNRDNIPPKFRDLHDSMYGRIDPVDTPDRDNCGIIQSLIPNCKLDETGRFSEEINEETNIVTIPLLTPFIEHNDQTRLQMAASQMRQAIPLEEFERPLIATKAQKEFLVESETVKVAKDDGEVVYLDEMSMLIVAYKNGEVDIIRIGPINIQDNLSLFYVNPDLIDNGKFNKGDILAYSHYYNDILMFGKNLLTGIMINGYNYEDGIVISESAAKKLTSLHIEEKEILLTPDQVLLLLDNDKPLYEELETINQGSFYARIKSIPYKYAQDSDKILLDEITHVAKKTYLVGDLHIYPNEWNTTIRAFNNFIEHRISKESERNNKIKKIIEQSYGKKSDQYKYLCDKWNLNVFDYIGRLKYKGEKINGVLFKFNLIYKDYISLGDKLANRHGGKGVITKIVPDKEMPKTKDDQPLEMIINPLGIISRMNLGQLFELHLGWAFHHVRENAKKMLRNNEPSFKIKEYIFDFIKLIDPTKDQKMVADFKKLLEIKEITEDFLNNLYLLLYPFESPKYENIQKALEYVGRDFEETIYDPKLNKSFDIALGYMYIMKLNHIAKNKLAARSIGPYSKRTLQPLGGKRNKGGQRFGEMEAACLIALDMPKTLQEFFLRSDSFAYVKHLINETESNEEIKTPEIVNLFDSYLKVIGIEIVDQPSTKGDKND